MEIVCTVLSVSAFYIYATARFTPGRELIDGLRGEMCLFCVKFEQIMFFVNHVTRDFFVAIYLIG